MAQEERDNKIEREDEEIGVGVDLLLPRDSLLSAFLIFRLLLSKSGPSGSPRASKR